MGFVPEINLHICVCIIRRFESLNQTAEERLERQMFYTEILKYDEHVVCTPRSRCTVCPHYNTLFRVHRVPGPQHRSIISEASHTQCFALFAARGHQSSMSMMFITNAAPLALQSGSLGGLDDSCR